MGRTHKENEAIDKLKAAHDLVLRVQGHPGPLVLVPGGSDRQGLEAAAEMAAAYSDAPEGSEVAVSVLTAGKTQLVTVTAAPKSRFKEWLI